VTSKSYDPWGLLQCVYKNNILPCTHRRYIRVNLANCMILHFAANQAGSFPPSAKVNVTNKELHSISGAWGRWAASPCDVLHSSWQHMLLEGYLQGLATLWPPVFDHVADLKTIRKRDIGLLLISVDSIPLWCQLWMLSTCARTYNLQHIVCVSTYHTSVWLDFHLIGMASRRSQWPLFIAMLSFLCVRYPPTGNTSVKKCTDQDEV
jgi:hypothetical protein